MLLQGTDCLHQGALKAVADAHDLPGGLHLGGKGTLCRDKLVERQSGNLHHAVIQRGFKAGIGFLCYGIFDLVQGIAQRNLGGHLCDRVSRGLGGQGRRTAHPGIHLDDTVLKAGGMQGKLHIAASRDLQFADNMQSGSAQHLVFLVSQGLGRSHHDTVPGVYAHRIDVFHITHSDTVSRTVPHDLVFDFLPARDTALHQHLPHSGKTQAVLQNFLQLRLVPGNSAPGTAQGIRRPEHHGISYGIGKGNALLHGFHHHGRRAGLPDSLHQVFEFLPSLRIAYGGRAGSQKGYAMGGKKARFLQFHPQVQSRLASQGRQNTVRFFLFYDLLQHLHGQGLNIYFIRDILVRHDGGRVGIHQNNLHTLFFQGTAGLGSRIVELCRLTDDNGPGTYHHDSFHIGILRHEYRLLSSFQ